MEYVIGLVLGLVGLLGWNVVKRRSAESLLQNNEVKSKINENNVEAAKKQGQIEAENAKVQEILDSALKAKNSPVKPEDFN